MAELSSEERAKLRAQNREREKRRTRQRLGKVLVVDDDTFDETSDDDIDEQGPTPEGKGLVKDKRNATRKRVSRAIAKSNRKIQELNSNLEKARKKYDRYRKSYQRLKKKNGVSSQTSEEDNIESRSEHEDQAHSSSGHEDQAQSSSEHEDQAQSISEHEDHAILPSDSGDDRTEDDDLVPVSRTDGTSEPPVILAKPNNQVHSIRAEKVPSPSPNTKANNDIKSIQSSSPDPVKLHQLKKQLLFANVIGKEIKESWEKNPEQSKKGVIANILTGEKTKKYRLGLTINKVCGISRRQIKKCVNEKKDNRKEKIEDAKG